ncbi:transposase, partial [Lachnospiraceae bacterium]|nr:transposase [Lachnospiraceae bacterium]
EGMHLSMEQKHQKILESFQAVRLKEYIGIKKNIKIRLQ